MVVHGPYHPPRCDDPSNKKRRRKPVYKITIHGFERVQQVACLLWPWLGAVKREQFRATLTTYLEHRNAGYERARLAYQAAGRKRALQRWGDRRVGVAV